MAYDAVVARENQPLVESYACFELNWMKWLKRLFRRVSPEQPPSTQTWSYVCGLPTLCALCCQRNSIASGVSSVLCKLIINANRCSHSGKFYELFGCTKKIEFQECIFKLTFPKCDRSLGYESIRTLYVGNFWLKYVTFLKFLLPSCFDCGNQNNSIVMKCTPLENVQPRNLAICDRYGSWARDQDVTLIHRHFGSEGVIVFIGKLWLASYGELNISK